MPVTQIKMVFHKEINWYKIYFSSNYHFLVCSRMFYRLSILSHWILKMFIQVSEFKKINVFYCFIKNILKLTLQFMVGNDTARNSSCWFLLPEFMLKHHYCCTINGNVSMVEKKWCLSIIKSVDIKVSLIGSLSGISRYSWTVLWECCSQTLSFLSLFLFLERIFSRNVKIDEKWFYHFEWK